MKNEAPFAIIGWREWIALPDFSNTRIKVKVDTGAKTSAIHAWKIRPFVKDGQEWVTFELHPDQRSSKNAFQCEAPVHSRKMVKSSNGHTETRFSIWTNISIGLWTIPGEITLTNRDDMGFRMLLGRTFIRNGFLVDSSRSFLQRKKLK